MTQLKRILVYGGSFDPPHRGHIELLASAIRFVKPDCVYIFPAYHSPLKSPASASFADRRKMINLATAELKRPGLRIIIDAFELRRRKKTYTYQTLRYLRKKYPRSRLYLLMGSDCMRQFDKWEKNREIASACEIIVGIRNDTPDLSAANMKFEFTTLPGVFPAVSSTDTRLKIYSDSKLPAFIPEPARSYIAKKKLYGLDIHRWLKHNLSKKRHMHSTCVAKLATQLAEQYDIDINQAALAGLLHDAGKHFANTTLINYVRAHRLKIKGFDKITANEPSLLHSYASSHIAESRFKIKDKAILRAIKNHTLGADKMSALEKILYVADISSEDRDFPGARRIRKTAFENIDKAVSMAWQSKLRHVKKTGKWFCPYGLNPV